MANALVKSLQLYMLRCRNVTSAVFSRRSYTVLSMDKVNERQKRKSGLQAVDNPETLYHLHVGWTNAYPYICRSYCEKKESTESNTDDRVNADPHSSVEIIESKKMELIKEQMKLIAENKNIPSENREKLQDIEIQEIEEMIKVIEQQEQEYKKRMLKSSKIYTGNLTTLAPLVPKSFLLRKLVQMGVDLSRVERNKAAVNMLVRMNFEKDILPCIKFLLDLGAENADVGHIITKFPFILKKDIDDMEVTVNYLRSKKFSGEDIVGIVIRCPHVLSLDTEILDAKLGWCQNFFQLQGEELRKTILRYPKLVVRSWRYFGDKIMHLKKVLDLSNEDIRKIFVGYPRLFGDQSEESIKINYFYCKNVIGYSHDMIIAWPKILFGPTSRLKSRHEFLQVTGRTQYDHTKPNFVSPMSISSLNDSDFCRKVAKVHVQEYDNFLKSI